MNKGKLNGLDLFSGIGGNTLGLRDYVKTVAYCEYDKHAQSVLLSRMADGSIESAPIWDDVTSLRGEHFDLPIDIIVGGFPCQDISVAGKQAGIQQGNRSGLFYEVMRLTDEIQPKFLFLENVPAIRTRGLDIVLRELTQRGYDCRWTMLSAAQVGAVHKRERWFMLACRGGVANTDEQYDRTDIRSLGEIPSKKGEQVQWDGLDSLGAEWPTPTKEDYWRRGPNPKQQGLPEKMGNVGGQLNPDWVEWLMGFPVNWTKASIGVLTQVIGKKSRKTSQGSPKKKSRG